MGALLDAALFADRQNPVPGARMLGNSLSVPTNANTTVTFAYIEFDTTGTQIANASAGTLTANRTGLWAVSGTATFNTTATQNGKWFFGGIARNGSTTDFAAMGSTLAYNGTYATSIPLAGVLRLAVGDYIDLLVNQNSGGSVSLVGGDTFLQMAFLGPA